MDLYSAIYLEVNLIGMIFPLLIMFRQRKMNDRHVSNVAYNHVVESVFMVLLLDAAWIIINGRMGRGIFIANYVVNILYMIFTGLINYLWLRYVLYRLRSPIMTKRVTGIVLFLPLAVLIVMCLSTPWTHLLFSVNVNNHYERGPLIIVQQIICYAYMVAAALYALVRALREDDRQGRDEAMTLAFFLVLPLAGSIFNIAVPGMPSTWPLAAVSLMMIYLNFQSLQISTDELTGLNNRRKFDRHLSVQIRSARREQKLYLILLDVDEFKTINDVYGHLAGDRALSQTSNILKSICGEWDCFLARYGGDEFVIVIESRDAEEIEQIKADIVSAFERFSAESGEPYSLAVSMGVSEYLMEHDTPDSMFSRADKMLYVNKAERKATKKA